MSVLTRKPAEDEATGLRGQAIYAARQVGPLATKAVPMAQQAAQQAVPLAKTAGTSVRQSADGAVVWATPYVEAARHWVAPQLEQSAYALTETIAPMISNALISASRKIDMPPQKPSRRRSRMLVASLALVLASVGTFLVVRNRQASVGYTAAAPMPDSEMTGSDPGMGYETDGSGPDADMNGHPRVV